VRASIQPFASKWFFSLEAKPMKLSLLREGDWAGIITMAIGLAALQKPGFPAHSRVSWGAWPNT